MLKEELIKFEEIGLSRSEKEVGNDERDLDEGNDEKEAKQWEVRGKRKSYEAFEEIALGQDFGNLEVVQSRIALESHWNCVSGLPAKVFL